MCGFRVVIGLELWFMDGKRLFVTTFAFSFDDVMPWIVSNREIKYSYVHPNMCFFSCCMVFTSVLTSGVEKCGGCESDRVHTSAISDLEFPR